MWFKRALIARSLAIKYYNQKGESVEVIQDDKAENLEAEDE